jgi:hypothetical protein
VITIALAALMSLTAVAQDCTISSEEEAKLLSAPYQEFDQTLGGGWRVYGDRGCYFLAAQLLDRYKEKNLEAMLDWQVRVVIWHSGQMYAFGNDYERAKARFENSFNPKEPADTPILWNDYVHATLAFLDKDANKVRTHRDRIANGPDFDGVKANLAVVDGLICCFDKPYEVAYSQCRE